MRIRWRSAVARHSVRDSPAAALEGRGQSRGAVQERGRAFGNITATGVCEAVRGAARRAEPRRRLRR